MGFVIELLSDRRLNLAVQIGSRLTRYDTHTTTHSLSHWLPARLGLQPDHDTLTLTTSWYGKATGRRNRRRDRDRKRLADLSAGSACLRRLAKEAKQLTC